MEDYTEFLLEVSSNLLVDAVWLTSARQMVSIGVENERVLLAHKVQPQPLRPQPTSHTVLGCLYEAVHALAGTRQLLEKTDGLTVKQSCSQSRVRCVYCAVLLCGSRSLVRRCRSRDGVLLDCSPGRKPRQAQPP